MSNEEKAPNQNPVISSRENLTRRGKQRDNHVNPTDAGANEDNDLQTSGVENAAEPQALTEQDISHEARAAVNLITSDKPATKEQIIAAMHALQEESTRLIELLSSTIEEDDEKIDESLETIRNAQKQVREKLKNAVTETDAQQLSVYEAAVLTSLSAREKARKLVEGSLTKNTTLINSIVKLVTELNMGIEDTDKTSATLIQSANLAFILSQREIDLSKPKKPGIPSARKSDVKTFFDSDEELDDIDYDDDFSSEEDEDNLYSFTPSTTLNDIKGKSKKFLYVFRSRESKNEIEAFKKYQRNLAENSVAGTTNNKGELTKIGNILTNLGIPIDTRDKEYDNLTGNKEQNIEADKKKLGLILSIAVEIINSLPNIKDKFTIPPEITAFVGESNIPKNVVDNKAYTELFESLVNNKSVGKELTMTLFEIFNDVILNNGLNAVDTKLDQEAAALANNFISNTDSASKDKLLDGENNANAQVIRDLIKYFSQADAMADATLRSKLVGFSNFSSQFYNKVNEYDLKNPADRVKVALLGQYVFKHLMSAS